MKVDWSGTGYIGLRIDHNQIKKSVTISMPNYIQDAVKRFDIDVSKVVNNPFESKEMKSMIVDEAKLPPAGLRRLHPSPFIRVI